MSARERILGRVREALAVRDEQAHPGAFEGWRQEGLGTPVGSFVRSFEAAGGEVVRVRSEADAAIWLSEFSRKFGSATVGRRVPATLAPNLASAPPSTAELGLSMARCAAGETGSLVLDAADGRRTQLLPPTHIVFLRSSDIHGTLDDALESLKDRLPSALGFHSGPSKSADIGQILVRGVHGPGRVIAVLMMT